MAVTVLAKKTSGRKKKRAAAKNERSQKKNERSGERSFQNRFVAGENYWD